MFETAADALLRQALWTVAATAGPLLGAALVVGAVVGFLQAILQIPEMTLTLLPKLAALAVILALLGPAGLHLLAGFAAGAAHQAGQLHP